MNQVKIHIGRIEHAQAVFQCFAHRALALHVVPYLCRQKNIFAGNTRLLHPQTDCLLVAINRRCVDMPVAVFQRAFCNRCRFLGIGQTEHAAAQNRNRRAVIECVFFHFLTPLSRPNSSF